MNSIMRVYVLVFAFAIQGKYSYYTGNQQYCNDEGY